MLSQPLAIVGAAVISATSASSVAFLVGFGELHSDVETRCEDRGELLGSSACDDKVTRRFYLYSFLGSITASCAVGLPLLLIGQKDVPIGTQKSPAVSIDIGPRGATARWTF